MRRPRRGCRLLAQLKVVSQLRGSRRRAQLGLAHLCNGNSSSGIGEPQLAAVISADDVDMVAVVAVCLSVWGPTDCLGNRPRAVWGQPPPPLQGGAPAPLKPVPAGERLRTRAAAAGRVAAAGRRKHSGRATSRSDLVNQPNGRRTSSAALFALNQSAPTGTQKSKRRKRSAAQRCGEKK